jgi:hypothetical protein
MDPGCPIEGSQPCQIHLGLVKDQPRPIRVKDQVEPGKRDLGKRERRERRDAGQDTARTP